MSVDLVSVIVPTYNRRDQLLKTLATIRSQTHSPLEIIVSDDGSADDTISVVKALRDERIQVLGDGTNRGVAHTRNRAIAMANGRWVSFCDDDDYWTRDKIARQVEALKEGGARWAASWAVNVDSSFDIVSHQPFEAGKFPAQKLWERNRIPGGCSNVMVEKSLLDEVGGFDPTLRIYADWDLWLRFAVVTPPARVAHYDVLYVIHAGQMTGGTKELFEELLLFRQKHEPQFGALSYDGMLTWVGGRSRASRDWHTLARVFGYSPKHIARIPKWIWKSGPFAAQPKTHPQRQLAESIEDVRARLLAIADIGEGDNTD